MIPRAALKSYRGFTLIELLVVMAIIAIAASLIGPIALNQYERSKATAEREALYRLVDHYRFKAYSENRSFQLSTAQTTLSIYRRGGSPPLTNDRGGLPPLQVVEFEYLRFAPQQLVLNRHGFWSPTQLQWQEGTRELSHQLNMQLIELGEEGRDATRND